MIPAATMSGFDSTTARTTLNSATRILKEVIPEEDEKEKEEKEKEEEEEEEEENKEDQEELWKVARQRSTEKLIRASFENKLADIDNILTSEENIINSAANNAEEERALHVCSSSKTVNFLIKRGADVQVRKRNKDQPLHVQCYAKNLKAIQYLLEAGADVNSRGDCGNSPLHLAASAAKIAQPKTRTGGNEMTSKNNSENVFETDESDIEKEDRCDDDDGDDDDDGGSLDDVKIETDDNTRVRIVMELISRGADVHAKNDNAQTPLLLLSNTQENESVAELLFKVQNRGQSAREEIKQDLARLKLQEAIILRRENLHKARMKREARKNKALAVKRAHEREVHDLETKLNFMENKERERIEEEQEKERLRIEAKKAKAKAKKASKR